jgi:CBS domain-containing protein
VQEATVKIEDVMIRDIASIAPKQTVREAARLMDDLSVGSLLVCHGKTLIGIITDRDIVVRVGAAGGDMDGTFVSDVMTEEVRWCTPEEDTDEAVRLMGDLKVRRVPVVGKDMELVGIVSLDDLARDEPEKAGEAIRNIADLGQSDSIGRA